MTLAQSSSGQALLYLGVLIALVLAAGVVVIVLRRRILGAEGESQAEGLMDNLRRMRDQGQLSQEEFEASRRIMARRAAGIEVPPRSVRQVYARGRKVVPNTAPPRSEAPELDIPPLLELPGGDEADPSAPPGTDAQPQ